MIDSLIKEYQVTKKMRKGITEIHGHLVFPEDEPDSFFGEKEAKKVRRKSLSRGY